MDPTQITEETLAIFSKAATSGITTATGIFGVDLSDLISLIPVPDAFRRSLARTGPDMGADVAQWKALLNVNNQQPKPGVAFDAAGPLALIQEINVSAPYEPVAMGYTVTRDAIARARGYADAKALAVYNSINQWKIGEDILSIGAQAFPLARPGVPVLADSPTGGTFAASATVYVAVAARTGSGYYYCNGDGTGAGNGNSRGNNANITLGTQAASTHSVSASITSVIGAVAYDWFYSSNGTTWFYYTTTTVPSVTVTGSIAANQTPPTATLPGLSTTVPTLNLAADNGSAGTGAGAEFNGLLATVTGDYTTAGGPIIQHGTGTSSGAILQDAAGSQFTVSGGGISQLDSLNTAYYNSIYASPQVYMVSAQEANSLGKLILNSPGAVTYLTMDDPAGRSRVVAGGRVGSYVNRITGDQVPIEVHPHMPPGTLVGRRDMVDFPNSNVNRVFEMRCLDDLYNYVYGSDRAHGGPREDGESRAVETFVNRAPVAQAVIQSLAPTP
jgi:hypothetical protein